LRNTAKNYAPPAPGTITRRRAYVRHGQRRREYAAHAASVVTLAG
jgi:hypothetical protein